MWAPRLGGNLRWIRPLLPSFIPSLSFIPKWKWPGKEPGKFLGSFSSLASIFIYCAVRLSFRLWKAQEVINFFFLMLLQYIGFTASEQVDPSWFGSNVCFLSVCVVHRPLSFDYNTSTWGELLSPPSVHVLLRFWCIQFPFHDIPVADSDSDVTHQSILSPRHSGWFTKRCVSQARLNSGTLINRNLKKALSQSLNLVGLL